MSGAQGMMQNFFILVRTVFFQEVKETMMKIIPSVVGLFLAGSLVTTVQAGPSKNEVATTCKVQINESFEAVKKVKMKRLREKSSGIHVTYSVFQDGAENTRRVTCIVKDGIVSLIDANGDMVGSLADASHQ